MKVVGLTGGVGMGKSTSARLLKSRGWLVIDTDLLARALVEPGQPALAEIARTFGSQVLDAEGRLRRGALAGIVFADAARRRQLEEIVHPRVRQEWLRQVDQCRAENRSFVAVVIPLLFETDAVKLFDVILCLACSEAAQRRRLADRGWDAQEIDRRIAAQWPVERKMLLAHYVIWTEASLAIHGAQLTRVLRTES